MPSAFINDRQKRASCVVCRHHLPYRLRIGLFCRAFRLQMLIETRVAHRHRLPYHLPVVVGVGVVGGGGGVISHCADCFESYRPQCR